MEQSPNAPKSSFSRRKFVAGLSALMAATGLKAAPRFAATAAPSGGQSGKLALHGGTPAVSAKLPKLVQWGDPERRRLNEMIEQDTLFYWGGPQTAALTERFQKHYPLEFVQTCSSGTAAIHVAMAAAGIGPGDEVITTPVTDIGSVTGIVFQQGVPVFADLVADTYNLDPADVARKITPKTKAILAVHLMGNPCDMQALRSLADQHGLILIEDCAQAWGARYRGRPVGTLGHIACFSLQSSKHITCGDGGIVASSDPRFGPLLQKFGDKGNDRRNTDESKKVLASNYRMSEPQAAVAAAQMDRMEGVTALRSSLGDMIGEEVAGAPGIRPHRVDPKDRCTYWYYMWRFEPSVLKCTQAEFSKALRAEGVRASPGYSGPIYQFPLFKNHQFFNGHWPIKEAGYTQMDYSAVTCPEAEAILKTCFRFRPNVNMDESYVRSVGRGIRKVAEHFA